MDAFVDQLYSSFAAATAAILLVSALVGGTVTQMVRDTERAIRAQKRYPKPPYLRTLYRLIATVVGMLTAWLFNLGLESIPVGGMAGDEGTYAGPGVFLSIQVGFFGGLFCTLVVAWAKGHLARNKATAEIAAALPSFDEDTDAIDTNDPALAALTGKKSDDDTDTDTRREPPDDPI